MKKFRRENFPTGIWYLEDFYSPKIEIIPAEEENKIEYHVELQILVIGVLDVLNTNK